MEEFEGYDIIFVAGQSNGEGNGQGESEYMPNLVSSDELVDTNPISIYEKDGKTVLDIVVPVVWTIRKAQERVANGKPFADLSLAFADMYEKKYLKANRKVLIVKTAVGGTGFSKKQWGVGNILSNRALEMTASVTENKNNKVVAILWHQGEHDAFEQAWLSPKERHDFYYGEFIKQMELFRDTFGKDVPIVTGEFVNDWAGKNKVTCDAVESALKDACVTLKNANCVSSEGLLSNDQKTKNGDDIHFCRESVYELGKRYFSAYDELMKA